ncbi:MAG: Rpp14/Pop5 family protein [Candidatus Micrarchaeia archaeon]|jgi:RNase P/RNase MRP subunit POP5
MQEKKRYILVSFESQHRLSKVDASKLVQAALLEGVGELGASKAKAFLKEFDEEAQRGIVKCQTVMLKEVLACLALKTAYAAAPIAIRTWKISGAIGNLWDTKKAEARQAK